MSQASLTDVTKKQRKTSKKRHAKDLSVEEKQKSSNMFANDIKISLKMKNKGWLSIGKIILKCMKRLILKILVNT